MIDVNHLGVESPYLNNIINYRLVIIESTLLDFYLGVLDLFVCVFQFFLKLLGVIFDKVNI
jgi:hypothetical protein